MKFSSAKPEGSGRYLRSPGRQTRNVFPTFPSVTELAALLSLFPRPFFFIISSCFCGGRPAKPYWSKGGRRDVKELYEDARNKPLLLYLRWLYGVFRCGGIGWWWSSVLGCPVLNRVSDLGLIWFPRILSFEWFIFKESRFFFGLFIIVEVFIFGRKMVYCFNCWQKNIRLIRTLDMYLRSTIWL